MFFNKKTFIISLFSLCVLIFVFCFIWNSLAFPSDFHPFIPGLEIKYAIEEANKLKVPVVLGGLEIDDVTLAALKVEPRMDPVS